LKRLAGKGHSDQAEGMDAVRDPAEPHILTGTQPEDRQSLAPVSFGNGSRVGFVWTKLGTKP